VIWPVRLAALLCLSVVASGATGTASLSPHSLRCEYLDDPLGIDVPQPRLSWTLVSSERGQRQSAYQVLVAGSSERLAAGQGDLWDSGRVEGDETVLVPYAGRPLASRQRCFWMVRVWDRDGHGPAESPPATWEMGLLAPRDWQPARWIAAARLEEEPVNKSPTYRMPWLRRAFRVPKPPDRARLYVTSLGYHNVYLNGRKVGDHLLDPMQSDHARRVFYVTHDVTKSIRQGENVLGAWLGKGWYITHGVEQPRPALLIKLVIDHPDGSQTVVAGDTQWRTAPSPLLIEGPLVGGGGRFGCERYDLRREQPGWNDVGFDSSAWQPAVAMEKLRPRELSAQMIQPNRVLERVEPARITRRPDGLHLIDCGRNVVGRLRLTVRGQQPGDELALTYSASHTGDPERLGEVFHQVDHYRCAGTPSEEIRAHLNWRAFRFVLVAGLRSTPGKSDVVAELVSTASPEISRFECSDPLLNRLDRIVRHTHRCLTIGGIEVDCPHRERLGYGAEGQAAMRQAMWNFQMGPFYTKWARDFADSQDPATGAVPYTAPFRIGSGGGPTWPGALIQFPWQSYQFYGDTRLLERLYPAMCRWVAFLDAHAQGGIVQRFAYRSPENYWEFLGDWAPPKTPPDYAPDGKLPSWPCRWSTPEENQLFNTISYAHQTQTLADIARVLSKRADAARYNAAAEKIRQAVRDKWFDTGRATFRPTEHPQTYLAFGLLTGVVPADLRDRAMRNLQADLASRQGHLDAGVLGSLYLIEHLLAEHRGDLILRLAMHPQAPSWRAMLDQGATTVWEHWTPAWSSVHNSFLSIGGWFIPGIVGIQLDPEAPGMRRVVVRPQPIGELTWARGEYQSVRGGVAVHWRRSDKTFELDVTLPPGITATVYLPAGRTAAIAEGGRPLAETAGAVLLRRENAHAVLRVESGRYAFSASVPADPPGRGEPSIR